MKHYIARLLLTLTVTWLSVPALSQDYDTLIQQALQQRNKGEMQAAEFLLRQARELTGDRREVDYLLSMVIAFQDRHEESVAVLERALADNPDDTQLLLGLARVRSFQGLLTQASQQTADILAREPVNQEALNLAGRIALYQRRPQQAREYFRQALSNDAEDLEAVIGLHDAEQLAGNRQAADEWLAQARLLAPDHIDVRVRSAEESPQTLRREFSAGYEQSRFRRIPLDRWHQYHVEYRHEHDHNTEFWLRSEHNRRFGLDDSTVELGALFQRQQALPVQFHAGFTPDADFSARHFVGASANRLVSEGNTRIGPTLLTGAVRYSDYRTGNTVRLSLGAEHYLLPVDAWLTPGVGLVRDENGNNSFGWQLGGHWQVSSAWRFGMTYADIAETENNITTDSRTWYAYLRWQPRQLPTLNLQLDSARHDRKGSYLRRSSGLSFRYRF